MAGGQGPIESVTSGPAGSVWVTQTADGLCAALDATLMNPFIGTTQEVTPSHCDTSSGVLTYGLAEAATYFGHSIIWGLVPNGNSTVTARLSSGQTLTRGWHRTVLSSTPRVLSSRLSS